MGFKVKRFISSMFTPVAPGKEELVSKIVSDFRKGKLVNILERIVLLWQLDPVSIGKLNTELRDLLASKNLRPLTDSSFTSLPLVFSPRLPCFEKDGEALEAVVVSEMDRCTGREGVVGILELLLSVSLVFCLREGRNSEFVLLSSFLCRDSRRGLILSPSDTAMISSNPTLYGLVASRPDHLRSYLAAQEHTDNPVFLTPEQLLSSFSSLSPINFQALFVPSIMDNVAERMRSYPNFVDFLVLAIRRYPMPQYTYMGDKEWFLKKLILAVFSGDEVLPEVVLPLALRFISLLRPEEFKFRHIGPALHKVYTLEGVTQMQRFLLASAIIKQGGYLPYVAPLVPPEDGKDAWEGCKELLTIDVTACERDPSLDNHTWKNWPQRNGAQIQQDLHQLRLSFPEALGDLAAEVFALVVFNCDGLLVPAHAHAHAPAPAPATN